MCGKIQKYLTNCGISTILNPSAESANTNRCAAGAGPGHTRPPAITWPRNLCVHTSRPGKNNNKPRYCIKFLCTCQVRHRALARSTISNKRTIKSKKKARRKDKAHNSRPNTRLQHGAPGTFKQAPDLFLGLQGVELKRQRPVLFHLFGKSDDPWIPKLVRTCTGSHPVLPDGLEYLKGVGFQINNTFFHDQFQASFAFLKVHKPGNGYTGRLPLVNFLFQIDNSRHLTCGTACNQVKGRKS